MGNLESAANKPCYLCGAIHPSHVEVREDGRVVGRVCASHTLFDVIFSRGLVGHMDEATTRLTVQVELDRQRGEVAVAPQLDAEVAVPIATKVMHQCPDLVCGRRWWGLSIDVRPRRCTCGERMVRQESSG